MSVRRLVALVGPAIALVFALVAAGEAAPVFEAKKLTDSNPEAEDYFGFSVSVSGDTAVVGAAQEDAGGVGFCAGAAFVFQRDEGGAGNWGEVKKLTASDADVAAHFGISVAVSSDTAIVGAYREDAEGFRAGAAWYVRKQLS